MWFIFYITSLVAFKTALSSSPKQRSIPDRSTAKEFQVRLSRGFAPYAGQVLVYHQGVWGAVCDDGWDKNDAMVVCRELGYPGVALVTKGSFGSAETINIEMVDCYGNETRLSQCSYKTSEEQSACRTSWAGKQAGVICEAANNTDDKDIPKVRLSTNPNWEGSGLVEVFMQGRWGRVCDDLWDSRDAEVVCRQLGFSGAEKATCCGWYFGRGSRPALMTYVRCTGKESSLFHCSHELEGEEASCNRRSSAGVICKLDKPNVRLVGSTLPHAGIVQIRHDGRWGSFCDWDWGLTQGHVVCRELGYRRALFTTLGALGDVYEQQSGLILVEEAQCTGNESSIFHCDLTYIRDIDDVDNCYHSHGGGVICESNKEPGLNETVVVRIQGGRSTHMGGVEIHQHGIWHAVCSIGWEKHDADVVCRQLGFPEAVVEVGHGQFGSGPGPMWLTSVGCQGNETSLDQCVSAGWELDTDCGKKYGAGVICKMDNITGDGEVRLRGSNEIHEGRVEVKLGGIWGTVSEKDWDIRDGHVVCRQLGYRHAVRVYSHSR
ncbi:Neurotrypsin [Desmophyllum pertusum]|uniref:Neurotrypsin n=1 Tax=Desmophyllum pertusum TaxID=174260 RepID=A0A9W9Z346_9CNID|nr:Neurotrypsin [Desmophyllum pertusum]